jgi:hypothetical protein
VIGGAGIVCVYDVALMQPIADGVVKPILTDWTVPGRPVYAVFPNARASYGRKHRYWSISLQSW